MFTVINKNCIKNALSSVLGVHLAELVYAVKGPVIICCGGGGRWRVTIFLTPALGRVVIF